MPSFPAAAGEQLWEAYKAGQESLGEVFSSAFDAELTAEVGELLTLAKDDLEKDWQRPGVHFRFPAGDATLVGMLQAEAAFLPEWCRVADEPDQKKLDTLGELLRGTFPDTLSIEPSSVELAEDLSARLPSESGNEQLSWIAISIKSGDETALFALMWVASSADSDVESAPAESTETLESDEPADSTDSAAGHTETQGSAEPSHQEAKYSSLEEGLQKLPPYAKSLLKVQVPVTVSLAESKVPISRIIELGPGSILQFQKSCEETLTLEAGDQEIAKGEAVKVGDKFGLWITSIAMPGERFWVMRGEASERIR